MAESIQICITKIEASTILDALYFLRGSYANQSSIDVANNNIDDLDISFAIYQKIASALECGDGVVTDCNDLLNCLKIDNTTSPSSITNITNIIGGATGGSNSYIVRNVNASRNENRNVATSGCDLALHFGRISEMIDILHSNNVDFFEWFELNTNIIEWIQTVSFVTGLDEASADLLLTFVTYLQEVPFEVYQAGYSDELRDQIRCDIFCRTKESCELKIADFSSYFGEKARIGIPDSLEQFLSWLEDFAQYGVLTPKETVYAIFNLQMSFLSFLDTQIQKIANGVMPQNASERLYLQLLLSDTADSDYTLLCECVQTYEIRSALDGVLASVGDGWYSLSGIGSIYMEIFIDGEFAGANNDVSLARVFGESRNVSGYRTEITDSSPPFLFGRDTNNPLWYWGVNTEGNLGYLEFKPPSNAIVVI